MTILDQEQNSQQTTASFQNKKKSSWVEIDVSAFAHNISSYKSIVQPVLFAPVIKSNAYGHGIEIIAQLCEQHNSVDMICLASLSEAVLLRSIGIKKPLLVLSILDDYLEYAVMYDIAIVIYDINTAFELDRVGKKYNKKISVHIKVDTGLSRLGLLKSDVLLCIEQISQLSFITITGIFTHFASSESADQTFTDLQINNFNFVIKHLESRNIFIPFRHTSCSAAATANIGSHFTLARAGIGIYGLWPSQDNQLITQKSFPQFCLKPVLTWKTRIILVKEIPAGSYVGYDLTYQATKTTQIATLPVGYWDGYDRELSNRGQVLINNQLTSVIAPVVGRVAMNLTMIDVTGLPVSVGDEVILLGNYRGIMAEDIAKLCNTINYEIVTRINPLVPRVLRRAFDT